LIRKKKSHPNFIFRHFIEFLREVSHAETRAPVCGGGCIDGELNRITWKLVGGEEKWGSL